MLVAHAEPVYLDEAVDWRLRAVRNITINIGCSCVYRWLYMSFTHVSNARELFLCCLGKHKPNLSVILLLC